jgi:cyclohexyl-isocyanide hydratase
MGAINVGFVIFPNLTQLDFTGPLQMLSRLPEGRMCIVAKDESPVPSDCGLGLVPTHTFANCPQLDVVCVPGGGGVADVLQDKATLDFVRTQAKTARYVTSVCTGAFVLGAAGLLQGRRATTHWGYTELLPMVGAVHEASRVVRDGNVVTAGGVTSGIDFGLTLLAEIAGSDVAEAAQLSMEYDPAPPFNSGSLTKARDSIQALVLPRYAKAQALYRQRLSELDL